MNPIAIRKRNERGVTLIEMLVVVTIIALFAALVAPRMLGKADAAKRTAARAQIEEQVVSVRGQVELARATLNTVRQQLTSGANTRPGESAPRINPVPRPSVPRLTPDPNTVARQRVEEEVAPSLNDLRAAVDALKRPRTPESNANDNSSQERQAEPLTEPESQ